MTATEPPEAPGATATAEPGARTPRAKGGAGREMVVAAVLCAAGAGLALLAAGRGWADATVTLPPPLPAHHVTLSGGDVAPALNGLGLAGLAGLAGIIATRGAGRLVVGVLIVAIGVGTAVSSIGGAGTGRVLGLLRERTAIAEGTAVHTATTVWWLAAVAGGVLLVAAGILTVARGRRWPGMSSRYDAPGTPRPKAAATPGNLWDSLDSGTDPTADPTADPAADSAADPAADRAGKSTADPAADHAAGPAGDTPAGPGGPATPDDAAGATSDTPAGRAGTGVTTGARDERGEPGAAGG